MFRKFEIASPEEKTEIVNKEIVKGVVSQFVFKKIDEATSAWVRSVEKESIFITKSMCILAFCVCFGIFYCIGINKSTELMDVIEAFGKVANRFF